MEETEARLASAFDDAPPEARQMALHLVQGGGKRVRPLLVLLSARLFGEDLRKAIPVAVAAEMIHMATLVHDDVIDEDRLRRGRPTAGRLWGNVNAVLSGDAVLARALVLLTRESEPRIVEIMAEMLYQMSVRARSSRVPGRPTPTRKRTSTSTASSGRLPSFLQPVVKPVPSPQAHPPTRPNGSGTFGRAVGMAFQVIDDLLDVVGEEEALGKPAGQDLAEGILTLPVLYLLRHPEHGPRVRALLTGGRPTGGDRGDLEAGPGERRPGDTYETARRFVGEAKSWLDQLPPHPLKEVLVSVADFSVERRL